MASVEVFAAVGVPKVLNYQGRLLDASGILLGESGTEFCFRFSFYDDSVVGAPDNKFWPNGAPSTMTITVKNGVFDAGIGDTLSGGDILDFDFQSQDAAYVNTEVAQKVGATCAPGDGAEVFENLSPRQRVVSSGYSINSDTVAGFRAAPSASGNQIPVLTNGNLFLGSLAPQINATSSNSLTIQGSALGGNLLLNSLSGFVGIGTTSPSQLLSVHGNAFFSGNIFAANIKATGTLNVTGLTTLTNASATQITTAGSAYLATTGGNVGIGSTSPWGLLSVNPDGISGPAFVVGSSTATLFSITQSRIGNLDFSRVTVGGPAKEDQLYVYGRINSSWRVYQREWMATCSPLADVVVDTADICGLVFDEDADGAVEARVSGSSAIRLRASTRGSLAVGEGAILGSGGSLLMDRNNNPVMEARVMPLTLTNHRIEAGFTVRALNGNMAVNTNGVYFRATPASPNWIAVNRRGAETAIDTGVAVSTTNFQELRIEINGNSDTRFFIDGALVAIITDRIPIQDLGFSVGNALITTANAVKNLDIESIKVWIDDLPERTSGEIATTSEDNPISEIQTAEAADSGLGDVVSRILVSLGLFIENGIAKFQEFIAEKAVIKEAEVQNLKVSGKIQLLDQITNEVYCTWIEDGEWEKVSGVCENISASAVTAPEENLPADSATTTDSNPIINEYATSTENIN